MDDRKLIDCADNISWFSLSYGLDKGYLSKNKKFNDILFDIQGGAKILALKLNILTDI